MGGFLHRGSVICVRRNDNGAIEIHNMTEQSSLPLYETVSSASPFPDEAISGALRNNQDMLSTTEISGGFNSCGGNWVEHSNYYDDSDLCVIWAMYNDSSLMFPLPEYGFDSWMAFKQFPPLSNPQYRVTNASRTALIPSGSGSQEIFINSTYFGPGSFSRGDHSRNSVSDQYKFTREYGPKEPLPSGPSALGTSRFISPSSSGSAYALPIDFRSYEQNFAKGFGSTVNSSPWHGAYQRNVGSSFNRNQFAKDKGGIRGRDMNTVSILLMHLAAQLTGTMGPGIGSQKALVCLTRTLYQTLKMTNLLLCFVPTHLTYKISRLTMNMQNFLSSSLSTKIIYIKA